MMNCTSSMFGRPSIKKSEISGYKSNLYGFQSWKSVENMKEIDEFDEEDMSGIVKTELKHTGSYENGSESHISRREGRKERNGTSNPCKIMSIPTSRNHHENGSPRMVYQSVPINIPILPETLRSESCKRANEAWNDYWSDGDDDEGNWDHREKIPPHELIAKQNVRSQLSSFSVYEGAGRTLKGRDLSRVRNAILIKTGFVD